ncbi:MYND-type domain-containing protein [Mycena chlorophos]|uniref:MYND-type domain-containing protein n=1 Tax=Mycena chlorophos TaxID=658473 RepID=A0A8H6SW09_MYCCL|nr:MYND-type domain-containing protein [Mycena chlorophos]
MLPHPQLRMDRLNLLPHSAKRVAQAACAPGRTKAHVLAVLKLATSDGLPFETKLALLPVVYHNTDPMRLPSRSSDSPRDDDSESDEDSPALMNEANIVDIMCSQAALQVYAFVLNSGSAPTVAPAPQAHSQLWARIWPWHLLVSSRANRWIFSSDLLFFGSSIAFFFFVSAHAVQKSADCSQMLSTPGFRRNLAQGWAMLPEWSYGEAALDVAIRGIFILLPRSEIHASLVHQQEIIQGLGGSLASAVEIIRKTARLFVKHEDKRIFCDFGTLFFVLEALENLPDQPLDKLYLGPIAQAIQSRTLIRQMTHAIAELLVMIDAQMHVGDATRALVHSLDSLGRYLNAHRPTYLVAALSAGLFRSVLVCGMLQCPGQLESSNKINVWAQWILRQVLYPQSNAFIQVARSMSWAATQAQDVLFSDRFKDSCLHDTWNKLLAPTLAARRKLVEKIDNLEDTSHRACDNIELLPTLRILSILVLLFGNVPTRRLEARRSFGGLHSTEVKRIVSRYVCASSGYDFKQRKFLRDLLSESFARVRSRLYVIQMKLMVDSPSPTEDFPHYAVVYDLRCTPENDTDIGIYFFPVDEIPTKVPELELNEDDFEDIARRARESDGRYQVHIVCLPGLGRGEHVERSVVVPLRSSSSRLFIEMRRVAERHKSDAEIDEDVLKREVEDVLAECGDVLEFH